MDPSHGPGMTLSIGSPAFKSVIDRDAGLTYTPGHDRLVENPWRDCRNCAPSSKRKREKDDTFQRTEVSGLSFEDVNIARGAALDLCMPKLSHFTSGLSTRSGTSRGTLLTSGVTEEGPPIGLDLGLAGPNSHGIADGCVTSVAMPYITNVSEKGTHRFTETNLRLARNATDILLELGRPSHCHPISSNSNGNNLKGFNVVEDSRIPKDLGMQLQLSLSNSSTVISDDDCVSYMSLGQGSGSTYPDTRNGSVCDQLAIAADDEGSTSGGTAKTGAYMPSLVLGRNDSVPLLERDEMYPGQSNFAYQGLSLGLDNKARKLDQPSGNAHASDGNFVNAGPPSSAERATKTCKFRGCSKGARGASGLCITHGGGRRCQRQGCNKGAEGRTVYCKLHGGGRRCQTLGCTKSAEGRTEFCISHGGGRRCSQDGCTKAARGRSGLCIRHGGGKRCQKEGCTKSAEGYSGLCISHGGGRRCQAPECNKGAQGSTMFCKAHGGGKRCMIQGCTKGAEGSTPLCKGHGGGKRCMFDGGGICTKSVHGGTAFCVAHGGGKRCAAEECTKSARGRTFYCVRHGGGKRCKFDNCTKSAQGSTDFCKAHGGGKRCSWGQEGSPYMEFVNDKTQELFTGPCDRFARGKIGLCAAHSALVQDRRVHGAETIGSALPAGIGPGLFRGLVNRVSDNEAQMAPALKNTSQEYAQGNEARCEYGPESKRGSDFFQRVSGTGNLGQCNDRVTFVDDEPEHASILEPSVGGNTRLTFGGIDLVTAQSQIMSQKKLNSGAAALNSGSIPSAYVSNKCKRNQTINMADGFHSANFSTDVGTSIFRNAISSGERRVLLPPQVLVPQSMKNGQFLTSNQRVNTKCGRVGSAGESGDSNFFFLPTCEARVHGGREERVHGGSVL